MRIKGKEIKGINVVTVVIPRGNTDNVIFRCQAVLDYSRFDSLCPAPSPPEVRRPGGVVSQNVNAPSYKAAMNEYSLNKLAFMVVESLKATPELEWDTVKDDSPETWKLYEKELRDSGFSDIEIGRIISGVTEANCLNESVIERARNDFLAQTEATPSA